MLMYGTIFVFAFIAAWLVLAIIFATMIGLTTYDYFRRGLYNRPLTAEESWAETSEEAAHDHDWSAILAEEHRNPHDEGLIYSAEYEEQR